MSGLHPQLRLAREEVSLDELLLINRQRLAQARERADIRAEVQRCGYDWSHDRWVSGVQHALNYLDERPMPEGDTIEVAASLAERAAIHAEVQRCGYDWSHDRWVSGVQHVLNYLDERSREAGGYIVGVDYPA